MSKMVGSSSEDKSAGSELIYSFSSVEWQRFADTLAGNGIQAIPPKVTELVALRRAVEHHLKTSGELVRPTKVRGTFTLQGERKVGDERNEYEQLMVCKIVNGVPTFTPQNTMQHRWTPALDRKLREHYATALQTLESEDLMKWFREQIVPQLQATVLESGMRFVPRGKLLLVKSIKRILDHLGCGKIHLLPLVNCDDVTEYVLAGMEADANKAILEIETQLAEESEITERGRRTKMESLKAIQDKLASYRTAFKKPLDSMNERLDVLASKLAGTYVHAATAGKVDESDAASKRFGQLEIDDKITNHVEDETPIVRPLELD